MENNRKKLVIVTLIILGFLFLGLYFYNNRNNKETTDENILQKFNLFGSSNKNQNDDVLLNKDIDDSSDIEDSSSLNESNLRLKQITSYAVSGAAFLEDMRLIDDENLTEENLIENEKNKPKYEIVPSIRYVERATGHVYQQYLDNKKIEKISNTTVPGVYEVFFNKNADTFLYRYYSTQNKSITSFLASLGGKSSTFLSSNLINLSLSPDKTKFFSLIKKNDYVIGNIESFDGKNNNQIFKSDFTEWISQWVGDNSVYLTTKASYRVGGNVYELNIKNGTLSKLFGNIMGLTTLANNDGSLILFNSSTEKGPELYLFNKENRASTSLNILGLPEKCVWSSNNISIYCSVPNTIIGSAYPDSWYQGINSFDDYFIKIDSKTGGVSTLLNSEEETSVDAISLFLDKEENTLFFINKKDYTLWSLSI